MEKPEESPNIKLYFSCRKVKKASSYRVLFTQKGFWKLQETEVLGEKDPNFKTPVFANYSFGKKQEVQVCLKESGEGGNYWVVNTTLNDIVGGRNSTKKYKVEGMLLIAKAEVIDNFSAAKVEKTVTKSEGKEHVKEVILQQRLKVGFRAKKVTNTDSVIGIFGKSDPFLRLHRIAADGGLTKIFESEHCKNTLNPKWKQIVVALNSLVDEKKGAFLVEVWDDEKDKPPQFIGSVEVKVEELKSGKEEFPLVHPKHKHPGKLKVYNFDISTTKNERDYIVQTQFVDKDKVPRPVEVPTSDALKKFLRYKKGGLQLSTIISIDFTKSNGDPKEKTSLHYAGGQNRYTSALGGIVDIIRKFDSEVEVPVFGFGAYCEFPGFTKPDVQYLIPLTGEPERPQVPYDNIVSVYANCLKFLKFNGPTHVRPVLAESNRICSKGKAYRSFQKYLVVLIFTDGAVDDINPVKKELALLANLPISVIMVGIGSGDFTGMRELLDEALKLPRPMFQFVEYQKYKNNADLLAEELLSQLPKEVVTFMEGRKVEPNDVDVDLSDMEDAD